MDQKYYLGIPEIDAQHEELNDLAVKFREAIADKNQRHLLHQSLKRLNQLLITHFEYEESLMAMVGYPGLPKHKQVHQGILKLLDEYFDHPPLTGDLENFGKLITEKVFGHIMEHDVPMISMVKERLPDLPKADRAKLPG